MSVSVQPQVLSNSLDNIIADLRSFNQLRWRRQPAAIHAPPVHHPHAEVIRSLQDIDVNAAQNLEWPLAALHMMHTEEPTPWRSRRLGDRIDYKHLHSSGRKTRRYLEQGIQGEIKLHKIDKLLIFSDFVC